jgi:hypothetical protein
VVGRIAAIHDGAAFTTACSRAARRGVDALAAVVLIAGCRAGYDAGAAVQDTIRDPHALNGAPR